MNVAVKHSLLNFTGIRSHILKSHHPTNPNSDNQTNSIKSV